MLPSLPLGLRDATEYDQVDVEMNPGDAFVLHTDGVNEARSQDQEEFGTARMLEILGACRDSRSGLASGVQALCKSVEAFSGSARPRDDITVVGVEVV